MTRSERPLRPASRPHTSSGASSRAWAMISSMCSGAYSTPPKLLRSFDRGGRVVVVVPVVARERLLELAHALPEGAPDLGQLLRAEHDERDGEDDDELHGSDVRHQLSTLSAQDERTLTTTAWTRAPRSPRPAWCTGRWTGTSTRRRRRRRPRCPRRARRRCGAPPARWPRRRPRRRRPPRRGACASRRWRRSW